MAAGWLLAPEWAQAGSEGCPQNEPAFAYLDADNDGCFTDGTDNGPINDLLLAGTYVGPAATGIVIPEKVLLRPDAGVAVDWTSSAALIVQGTVQTDGADLDLLAASSVRIGGKIEARAEGDSVSVACTPACSGGMILARGSAIKAGNAVAVTSASTLDAEEKTTLDADSGALTVSADTRTAFGELARLSAGTTATFQGYDVTIGERSKVNAEESIAVTAGHAVSVGGRSKITARTGQIDVGAEGGPQQILLGSRIRLSAGTDLQLQASNSIVVAEGGSLRAGKGGPSSTVKVLAGTLADLTQGARIRAEDFIQVTGATIGFAGRSKIEARGDSSSIDFLASNAISIEDTGLQAGVGSMSVQSGGAISLLNSNYKASGASPALVLSATDSGTCDLTGTRFRNVSPTTVACGTVVSPSTTGGPRMGP